MSQLRFWIFDDGILIRKLASRIECQPYIDAGCELTVLPKVKIDYFNQALALVGEAPF
jgi:hypothetical protein